MARTEDGEIEVMYSGGIPKLYNFSVTLGWVNYGCINRALNSALREKMEIACNQKPVGLFRKKVTFYGNQKDLARFKLLLEKTIEYY